MKLAQFFEAKYFLDPPIDDLYVVFYRVRRSRINGSYLVNAKNKIEAKTLVKQLNSDYFSLDVWSFEQAVQEIYGYESAKSFLEDSEYLKAPKPGEVEHIESGT